MIVMNVTFAYIPIYQLRSNLWPQTKLNKSIWKMHQLLPDFSTTPWSKVNLKLRTRLGTFPNVWMSHSVAKFSIRYIRQMALCTHPPSVHLDACGIDENSSYSRSIRGRPSGLWNCLRSLFAVSFPAGIGSTGDSKIYWKSSFDTPGNSPRFAPVTKSSDNLRPSKVHGGVRWTECGLRTKNTITQA